MTEAFKPIKTFRELRIAANLTQEQTAKALGVSVTTANRIERGQMHVSMEMYKKINVLFGETAMIKMGATKSRGKPTKKPAENQKVFMLENEKRFLKTCWNMKDALRADRMIVRDLVDATYEFMETGEALTCLYKWSKIGFYHYPKGGVVDQGYFLWDDLPPKYRRIVSQ